MNEIEQIIEATETYIKESEITSIDDLTFTRQVTNIFLNQKIGKEPYKFNKKVSLKESIKYADDFLKSINEKYSEYFSLRLNDDTFIFDANSNFDEFAYSEYDAITKKRTIYIPLEYNIYDSFLIIHELFHDINIDETEKSMTRSIFTEGLSILGEILLYDYLKENKIKDVDKAFMCLLNGIKYRLLTTDYNLKLIEKYLKDGYLDKKSIFDLLEEYNMDDIEFLIGINKKIIEEEILTLDEEQSYIFGFLITLNIYDKIKKKKKNIQELFELNEMLKFYEIEDVLNYLNISYTDDYILSEKEEEKTKKQYKDFVKRR